MMNVFCAVPLCAIVLLGLLFAPAVDAHGWIEKPLARQFCNGNKAKWDVSISGGNGARDQPTAYGGVPGLCGDPFEGRAPSNFVNMPCTAQETYQEGGIMSMQIDVAANHGGFWEVSICDSENISQECFDRNKLKTVEHDVEQWHIMDRKLEDPTDKRPDSYFMDWKLPPGLTCEKCVVQWSWWTAHNCVYPCDEAVCGFYAQRRNKVVRPDATWDMKFCETRYPAPGQKPQMFRNCADIKIEGSGGTVPQVDPVPPPTETVSPPVEVATPPTEEDIVATDASDSEIMVDPPVPAPAPAPTPVPVPEPEQAAETPFLTKTEELDSSNMMPEESPALELKAATPPVTTSTEEDVVDFVSPPTVMEPAEAPEPVVAVAVTPAPEPETMVEDETPMKVEAPVEVETPMDVETPIEVETPTEDAKSNGKEESDKAPSAWSSWWGQYFSGNTDQSDKSGKSGKNGKSGKSGKSGKNGSENTSDASDNGSGSDVDSGFSDPPTVTPVEAPVEAPVETPMEAPVKAPEPAPVPASPPQGDLMVEEDACMSRSRRFLLGEDVLEVEDGVDDISGAGNAMNCGNLVVAQVLVEVNQLRMEVRAHPLECSNRAVGVAENFSNMMADMGMELDDSTDNCNLAGFKGRCVQMVATGGTGAPVTTLTGIDHAMLVAPEYAVAGVGYYDVNGITYWTILMG